MVTNKRNCGVGLLLLLALFTAGQTVAQKTHKAAKSTASVQKAQVQELSGAEQRAYLAGVLSRIADPVQEAVQRAAKLTMSTYGEGRKSYFNIKGTTGGASPTA